MICKNRCGREADKSHPQALPLCGPCRRARNLEMGRRRMQLRREALRQSRQHTSRESASTIEQALAHITARLRWHAWSPQR